MNMPVTSSPVGPSAPTPKPHLGIIKRVGLSISLAYNFLIKKAAEVSLNVLNSPYLEKIDKEATLKILHIELKLGLDTLPPEIRKYLMTSTRNLPSMMTYTQGDIGEQSTRINTLFKKILGENIAYGFTKEVSEKKMKKLDARVDQLNRAILHADPASCFEGVCHAMISQVAKDFLSAGDAQSISEHAKKFEKGVDAETTSLQMFMLSLSSHTHYPWNNFDAVDSVLGLAATSIPPEKFTTSQMGLFHIAIPAGGMVKHSLLLNVNNTNYVELLDPNFGIFKIPTSEFKNFMKQHLAFYLKNEGSGSEVTEYINKTFSENETEIYSHNDMKMEIRQLEKAVKHKWMIGYTGDLTWEREFKYQFDSGTTIKVQL